MTTQHTDEMREAYIRGAKTLRVKHAGLGDDKEWVWSVTSPHIKEKWIARFGEAVAAAGFVQAALNQPQPTADVVEKALHAAKKELLLYKDDAFCEHDVGICSCAYWRTISQIDAALSAMNMEDSGCDSPHVGVEKGSTPDEQSSSALPQQPSLPQGMTEEIERAAFHRWANNDGNYDLQWGSDNLR